MGHDADDLPPCLALMLRLCGAVPPLLQYLHGMHRECCTFTLQQQIYWIILAFKNIFMQICINPATRCTTSVV
jgi:hypothetical protein